MLRKTILVVLLILFLTPVIHAKDPLAEMGITYLFKEAVQKGVVDESVVTFTVDCSFEVFGSDTVKFPLFESRVSLLEYEIVRGDERDIILTADGQGIYVIATDDGEFTVRAKYVAKVAEQDGRFAAIIPLIPAVTSTAVLEIPGSSIAVESAQGVGLRTEQKEDLLNVEIFSPGATSVPLSWWEEKKRTEKIDAMVTCEEFIQTFIGRAGLQMIARFDFNIIQGEREVLSLSLPDGLNLLDVKGQGISYWNLQKTEEADILDVTFIKPASGLNSIVLVCEKGIKAVPAQIEVPSIIPSDVKKVSGYVAVSLEKGLKIGVSRASEIRQIDVSTLPPSMKTDKFAAHLGFRFIQETFALSLDLNEIEPRVFAYVFTKGRLGLQNLKAKTVIVFDIKNAGVFGFSVRLPEGLKLLDISGPDINSWNVKKNILHVDLRSRALGTYTLELQTDTPIKDPENVVFPSVTIEDVENERGYIEMEPAAGMKIRVTDLAECTQIDKVELPANFTRFATQRQDTQFFRYIRHPFTLTAAVDHIQPEISSEVDSLIRLEERGIEMNYEVRYFIDKAGVYSLEIEIDPELQIVDVAGSNIDIWKKEGSKLEVVLQKKIKGNYKLFITCEKPLKKLIPSVAVPRFRTLNVKKEKGTVGVAVNVPVNILTHPDGMKDIREVEIRTVSKTLRTAGIVQAYRYYKQPWELELRTETVDPRLKATVFSFVSVGRGAAAVAVMFEYDIADANNAEFFVEFPEGSEEVVIEGKDAKPAEKMGKNLYKVVTHSGKRGTYTLHASFRLPQDDSGMITYKGVKVNGVDNQSGYVILSASEEMEFTKIDEKNLNSIDYDDVDPRFKVGITSPVLASFSYHDAGYSLDIHTVSHKAASVVVAVVEMAKAHTTVSPNGSMMTDIFFKVRNTSEQFLRLNLPEKSEILHLVVNGKETSPKGDDETKETLIPISGIGGKAKEFRIYLRYKSDSDPLGLTGDLNLTFPGSRMKILQLGWIVDVPEGYRVTPGDCQNIEPVHYIYGALGQEPTQFTGQILNDRVNNMNPGAHPGANQGFVKDVQEWNRRAANQAGMRTIYTGQMPSSGNEYSFMSLFPMEKNVSVQLSYVKNTAGNVLIILVFLAVFTGISVFTLTGAVSIPVKNAAISVLVLLIGVILVGQKELSPVLITTGAAVILGFSSVTVWKKFNRFTGSDKTELLIESEPQPRGDEKEHKKEDSEDQTEEPSESAEE